MAGTVKSAQSVTCVFCTSHPSTGAATTADSLPGGTLYVNGVANAASVTVTLIDQGRYKAAVTLPSLAAGDVVDISIAATVNSIAGKATVWSAVADTKRVSDLNDSAYAGGAVASVTAGVTVTTNNDKTGYTASTVSDKTGYSLSVTPPTAVQVRQEIDSNSTKLDVAVGTRSNHSAADVWAVTTRTLSSFGTLVADVAAAVLAAIQAAGTHLTLIKAKTDLLNFTGTDVKATLDGETVAVSDKTGFSLATAPATPTDVTAVGDAVAALVIPSASDIDTQLTGTHGAGLWQQGNTVAPLDAAATADAVLDALAADHDTVLTIGALIGTAGAAADPLLNAVPGSYDPGTAGYLIGRLSAATIGVTSPLAADSTLTLYAGAVYETARSTAIDLGTLDNTAPDLSSADSVTLYVYAGTVVVLTHAVTVTGSRNAQALGIPDLSSEDTQALLAHTTSKGRWVVEAVWASGDVAIADDVWPVKRGLCVIQTMVGSN